jgi:hypothetical protein
MSEGPGVPEEPAFMPREFAAELRHAISRAAGKPRARVHKGASQGILRSQPSPHSRYPLECGIGPRH